MNVINTLYDNKGAATGFVIGCVVVYYLVKSGVMLSSSSLTSELAGVEACFLVAVPAITTLVGAELEHRYMKKT